MIKKEVLIGFVIAIFTTLAGFYIYVEYVSKYGFELTLKLIHQKKLYSQVLVLAAIPNLFVFFIFLKKKQDYRARGVLLACLLLALLVFAAQFL